jgi:hypothetical protein
MFTPAQQAYIAYLQDQWPDLYENFVRPQLTAEGLGATDTAGSGNIFSNILNTITSAIPQLSSAYAQVRDAQAQARIAELQRQTQIAAAQGGGFGGLSTSTLLMLAAAGLVGVYVLSRK